MKNTVFACLLLIASADCLGQPLPVAQMKTNIEHAANPVAYVRENLKKKYKIDTVTITNSTHFSGLADSLAYSATLKKKSTVLTKERCWSRSSPACQILSPASARFLSIPVYSADA